ncbi:MAG TPA: hypothetical protein VF989_20570 [Polyangiaceae bacterium]
MPCANGIKSLLLAGVLLVPACKSPEPEVWTPERVVSEFIARVQRVHGAPEASRAAFELLWSEARQNLGERAERATAVAGRTIEAYEMIAPSRVALRGTPHDYSARVDGNWAIVTARTDAPETEYAVRCVREGGEWRIALELPPLPGIERRSASE